ncbi:MAG TPA: NlpC/P60 family protein [Chthoniobacterales bacterium]|nr:NlpC/P60 family protein [Chthoniobacterales bacterium]
MQRTIKIALALFVVATIGTVAVRAPAEDFGTKLKKIFEPTPTPTPRKHTKKKSTAEKSPTPKPSATPDKSPSPKKKAAASPTPSKTASPSASASAKKKKSSPTATPEASPSSTSKKKKRKTSPTQSPSPGESPSPSASASASPEATQTPKPTASSSPSPKKKGAPATVSSTEIIDYEKYPKHIRNVTDMALELTRRNLDYKYGSADPASGGMDCSGFVFYVLTQNGLRDVPRDSSQQYVWLRKAGTFKAVNSRHDDTFELDDLVPGDLLFWTGTYSVERDPPITHAMIYLGRKKGSNQRVMVGASDGRTYEGESRYGVSVFDFKVSHVGKTDEGRLTPMFIGYGHIPGL